MSYAERRKRRDRPANMKGTVIMKEPKNMRFGDYIKYKRQQDSRELTLKDVSNALEMSLSMLSDIEQKRRRPFDDEKIVRFCDYLNLGEEELSMMRDLAAKEKGEIPADIEDTMMYSEIGDMARHALRLANEGYGDEEDWKQFIRQLEDKKRSNQ